MEVAEIFMADFEEEWVFANKYATIQLDCPEIYKPETPLPFHLVCVENDVSIAGATIDTSLHATTFPANLPSPISSEIFFGSPQASYDPCGSCKVKSEEDNDLAIHEQFIPTELNAIHNLWMEIPNDLSTLLQIERQPPKFTFAEVKDKYHVLEKIGEGTFSSVFKAISLDESMEIVALKRIYPTCSPQRILNEIKFLHLLGGKGHVAPLHRVLRYKDQVTLVLSNIEHMKFKDYLPFMTIDHIRQYMKALFEALQHLHSHNIIHRDLKPGNFLHNPNTNTFALVDFGLAQVVDHLPEIPLKMRDKGSHSCSPLKRKRTDISLEQKIHGAASRVKLSVNNGAFARDSHGTSKKSMRAPRGGTRGFRAPEVLMKCLNQTVAIDIWSAGVILLCILSTRYPFFTAPDDLVSLAEIGALFGTKEVKEVAHLLNRKITFPTDPLEIPKSPLKYVCNRLTSRNYIVPDSAFHLLERCLDLNPMTRITASEALKHPFLLICDTN